MDGNVTASTLSLLVSAEDGGQYLTCRAENLQLVTSVLEDTWKLNVQCKDSLSLSLSLSLFRFVELRRNPVAILSLSLSLADVPVVRLELGSKLQASLIKEGDDVYMECSIRANPWVTRVVWKHNVSERSN